MSDDGLTEETLRTADARNVRGGDISVDNHARVHLNFLMLQGRQWTYWIPRVWWRPSTWFSKKFGRWATAEEMAEIERRVSSHMKEHAAYIDYRE